MTIHEIFSRITDVTVYADRAQMTRRATVQLSTGEHTLVFSPIPTDIDVNSLQANGSGAAILRDVKLSHAQFVEVVDERMHTLVTHQQQLQDEVSVINDALTRNKKERQFIDRIVTTLTQADDEPNSYRLDPDRWIKMVDFYRARMISLDNEERQLKLQQRELNEKIDQVSRQISTLQGGNDRSAYQVEVVVEILEDAEISIDLSYVVYGPRWHPVYELRVDSDNKQMNIGYYAMVQQSTMEDWDEVNLNLSTAQPHIGGSQPMLDPWRLFEYTENSDMNEFEGARDKSKLLRSRVEASQLHQASIPVLEEVMTKSAAPIGIPVASVNTQAASVVFSVAGQKTIASDHQPHRVCIAMQRFPAYFRYATVPKLTPYAYLKAKVKNNSEYPLLPGESHIFLDNHFVGKAYLNMVAPGEDFWTDLGIDAAIKVDYQFLKRLNKQSGLIHKSEKFTYEYQIKLTNNKKTDEEIVVWDQIPISNHDKIMVELITPVLKEGDENIKRNEMNYIEWKYILKAGEKNVVPFCFSIEHPQEMKISGL